MMFTKIESVEPFANEQLTSSSNITGKKDLELQVIAHGTALVATIAMGASDAHTIRTILEAEAFLGPSIIIEYAHCIAHPIDMAKGAYEQHFAVKSGYWPLFHYNQLKPQGQRFVVDSKDPSIPLAEFMYHETRFKVIKAKNPELAEEFLQQAEEALSDGRDCRL